MVVSQISTADQLEIGRLKMEPVVGFEPTTDGLQNRCSTTELNWRAELDWLVVLNSAAGPKIKLLATG